MTVTLLYVTKLIFKEYLKTSYNLLTFQCFYFILKLIMKFLHLFLLKQIIKHPIML